MPPGSKTLQRQESKGAYRFSLMWPLRLNARLQALAAQRLGRAIIGTVCDDFVTSQRKQALSRKRPPRKRTGVSWPRMAMRPRELIDQKANCLEREPQTDGRI